MTSSDLSVVCLESGAVRSACYTDALAQGRPLLVSMLVLLKNTSVYLRKLQRRAARRGKADRQLVEGMCLPRVTCAVTRSLCSVSTL